MFQRGVIARGFWASLFLGSLRLEHRPENKKLIVIKKGHEQSFDYHELRYVQAQGSTCLLVLYSTMERYTFLPKDQVADFCDEVNASLTAVRLLEEEEERLRREEEARRRREEEERRRKEAEERRRREEEAFRRKCRPVFDRVLAFRSSYLRDSEWAQCRQAIDALQDCQKEGLKKFFVLFSNSDLQSDEITFLSELLELHNKNCNAATYDDAAVMHFVRSASEQYLLNEHSDFLDLVEKYPLNAEQRQAVVRTNDRNLILAAAGTGKTSVIVAKALYLLQSGEALPEDILIMAYNRAAADEIKERLNVCADRAGIDASGVNANTFHALGRSVLVDCKVPARVTAMATDEAAFNTWIDRWLYTYLKEDSSRINRFIDLFMGSVLFDQVLKEHTITSEHADTDTTTSSESNTNGGIRDFNSDLILQAPPELYRTLNNEKVKSRQEVFIANWLATNGVPYKYEDRYLTKVRLEPGFDYKPDFHIIRPRTEDSVQVVDEPQIYLEHYGIDREGNTRPDIDKEAYNNLIVSKRQLHQKHGTILLETYSYQFADKSIEFVLENHMKAVGIPLRPCSPAELLQRIKANKSFGELRELLERCLQVIREFNYTYDDLLERYQKIGLRYAKEYAEFFTKLVADYQSNLETRGEIDFCDMIIQASDLIAEGQFRGSWRYILVDEFQDISLTRLRLLQRLFKQDPKCSLTCVGDDWQAIYHFAGGILDATIHFENYFGSYTLTTLVQTYRYPKSIADTAGTFVQENPQQFRKHVISLQKDEDVKIHLLDAVEMGAYTVSAAFCIEIRELKYVHSAITSAVAAVHQAFEILKDNPDATIAIISRYNKILEGINHYLENVNNYPANLLLTAHLNAWEGVKLTEKDLEAINRFVLDPDVVQAKRQQIKLWTMHKSKGLEADFVILAGFYGGSFLSFPCRMKDSELLEALLDKLEDFADAEERRLFYVTMTRAKRDAYLISDTYQSVSSFAAELLNPKYKIDIQVEAYQAKYLRQYGCKVCHSGIYTMLQGQYGPYYVCSNEACSSRPRVCELCGAPSVDKEGFSECTNPLCGNRLPLCKRCGRPMKLRDGRYGQFYGCSGYGLSEDACNFSMNYEAMQRLLSKNSKSVF